MFHSTLSYYTVYFILFYFVRDYLAVRTTTDVCCYDSANDSTYIYVVQGGAKTGPPAILYHCKYSENSMTELHGNCCTSAILYAEHSHYVFVKKFHRAVAPLSENTATVVYSHCTNRFEHHTTAVFSLGGATAR